METKFIFIRSNKLYLFFKQVVVIHFCIPAVLYHLVPLFMVVLDSTNVYQITSLLLIVTSLL